MLEWLETVAAARDTSDRHRPDVPGRRLGRRRRAARLYRPAACVHLSDLETILLQKIGPACVAAHNAYQMCLALPKVAFLAMEARHCAGAEMQDMMAYAASVGSAAAKREGASGFIGNANDGTAHWFGAPRGFGTMPHSLIGYAGIDGARRRDVPRDVSRRADDRAGRLFRPRDHRRAGGLRALSRSGRSRASCRSGWTRMAGGSSRASIRPRSYAVLERHAPGAIRRYRSDTELRYLVGTGVSAAAIWRMREALDEAGYRRARIVASSGFGVRQVPGDGGCARRRSTWSAPAASFRIRGTRPMPPPTSSNTTACRW